VGNLHLDDARLTVAFNGQGDILADARCSGVEASSTASAGNLWWFPEPPA
jgi:hypothetical protein